MSLSRLRQITEECYDDGNYWESSFRKTPALASTQGIWSDMSGAPGNPRPNYYVGAELTSTTFNGPEGLYHGGDVSPKTKHLHKMLINCAAAGVAPAAFILCDYLLFYPLVDMDSTDQQAFVNSVSLPRYTDGDGVMAMLVATNPYVGGAPFYIEYTNHAGLSRSSVVATSNTTTFIGTVLNSGLLSTSGGPFIRLAPGDRGVRSVQNITFTGPNGGLAALVLVKPLATLMLNEVTSPVEYDFLTMRPSLPRIYDGAYLNMIGSPNGSWAAAPINGMITTIWA